MEKIVNRVYLGNWAVASELRLLQNIGITHIINCAHELPCKFHLHFKYLHIKVRDNPTANLKLKFEKTGFFIQSALDGKKNKILIHCNTGESRSGSVLIAYLMFSRRLSFQ